MWICNLSLKGCPVCQQHFNVKCQFEAMELLIDQIEEFSIKFDQIAFSQVTEYRLTITPYSRYKDEITIQCSTHLGYEQGLLLCKAKASNQGLSSLVTGLRFEGLFDGKWELIYVVI